jgi:hypothetical protein
MTLLATFDHLWESKWNPIRNYQTVSLGTSVNKGKKKDRSLKIKPRPSQLSSRFAPPLEPVW